MLVDSHCHLDYMARDGDLDDVLARARNSGIETLLTISTSLETYPQVRDIAAADDRIFCTVGVHPHNAEKEPDVKAEQLIKLANANADTVGIGECGLDYFYEHSPRDVQQAVFREHIAAARETGLPLIVHTRDADQDTVEILTDEMEKGAFTGLIHCFSSSDWLASRMLAQGFYLSISGIVTFKTAEALRETVSKTPLDRLLVETDAPYLAPIPKRGKRNEPAFTAYTAAKVAELKGVSDDEVASITTDNFFNLFKKARKAA